VFHRLREILQKHAGAFRVERDTADHYSLHGPVGPATLRAWRGKMRSDTIPVAWVQIGKAYVAYHLMGVYGNRSLLQGCTPELRSRMQGKSCFNFKQVDDALFRELEQLTARSLAGMKAAGFISDETAA